MWVEFERFIQVCKSPITFAFFIQRNPAIAISDGQPRVCFYRLVKICDCSVQITSVISHTPTGDKIIRRAKLLSMRDRTGQKTDNETGEELKPSETLHLASFCIP